MYQYRYTGYLFSRFQIRINQLALALAAGLTEGLGVGLVMGLTVAEVVGDVETTALCVGDPIAGLVEPLGLAETTFDLHPQSIETNNIAGIIRVAIFFIF